MTEVAVTVDSAPAPTTVDARRCLLYTYMYIAASIQKTVENVKTGSFCLMKRQGTKRCFLCTKKFGHYTYSGVFFLFFL